MKNRQKLKISYESEADVLTFEVSKKPIDFAEEMGNIVIHFSKDNSPVLLEILEASEFLSRAENIVGKNLLNR